MAGISKVTGFSETAGYMSSMGIPLTEIALILTIILEIAG